MFSTLTQTDWSDDSIYNNPLIQKNLSDEQIKELFEKSSSTPKALQNWAIAVLRIQIFPTSERKAISLWLIQKLKELLPRMEEFVKTEEVDYEREMAELQAKYSSMKDSIEALNFIKQLQ